MSCETFEATMEEIIAALEQAGYDPHEQIYSYIQTGKLEYITRHNNARNKIAPLNKPLIWKYINSKSVR